VPIVEGDRQQDVMGSRQDLLAVYDTRESLESAPLWQERGAHGLKPPEVRFPSQGRHSRATTVSGTCPPVGIYGIVRVNKW